MSHGIDLSNNNSGPVDWTGVEFAFLKATEDTGFVDRTLPTWRDQCVAAGIPWGPYHFAHPDQHSAQEEAAFFLANAPKGTLAPALDFETRKGVNPLAIIGVDAGAAWINEWCSIVAAAWGQVPFFYSFRDYVKHLAPQLQAWPLWLATASGAPGTFTSFEGLPVAIEQWGIVGGVDQNESYIALTQETDDMIDPDKFNNVASAVFNTQEAAGRMELALWALTHQAGADVDVKKLAAELAPVLSQNLQHLTPEDLAAVAKAVNDEQARRQVA